MPPHVRRGGARGRSNTPRHAAQARADLSAGRSAPRTQGKFAAFDEFCKRLIMKAAGLQSPDISILSDEFLAEVRETDKKNLAIEALRKLINGDVRAQSRSNVTQSRAFSERLDAAIARYHANALTTAQVLEELIQLAKDIRAAHARGEEMGLSKEEVAFYDALAENQSARELMGEPALRVIAHELVTIIKSNVTVD